MSIEQRGIGNVVLLSVSGDIAMNVCGATLLADGVRQALQEGSRRLLLDLRHVRYVDSAGLGELVQALSATRNRGGSLKLLNLPWRVKELLGVAKLLSVFECFEDLAEALASFDATAPFSSDSARTAG